MHNPSHERTSKSLSFSTAPDFLPVFLTVSSSVREIVSLLQDKDSYRNLGHSLTPRRNPVIGAQLLLIQLRGLVELRVRLPHLLSVSAARNLLGEWRMLWKNKSGAVNTPFRPVWTNQEQICHLVFVCEVLLELSAVAATSITYSQFCEKQISGVRVCVWLVEGGWIMYGTDDSTPFCLMDLPFLFVF